MKLIIKTLKGKHTVETIQAELKLTKASAMNLISKLRKQGYKIHTTEIVKTTRFGMKKTIAKYLYFKPKPQFEQKLIWG